MNQKQNSNTMMRQNDNITVMQKRDDQEMITLLLAFEEGDATAFSKLYDLNVNLLFSYGCKLTTDRELLKDCIHDVFVKMYTKKEELKHVENFKSYCLFLYGIDYVMKCVNVCMFLMQR